jgi:hypothetical protein
VSADVRVLRATRAPQDRAEAQRIREKAEANERRMHMAAQRIRRMTRLYIEREDGKARDD